MATMDIALMCMVAIIMFVLGLYAGKIMDPPIVGKLIINGSDPSEDLLAFQFEKDLDIIEKAGVVSFEVKKK